MKPTKPIPQLPFKTSASQALALGIAVALTTLSACSSPEKSGTQAPPRKPAPTDSWLGGSAPNASGAIPERREFPVNPAINPCDDFFQYACSETTAHFKMREDRSRHIFAFNDSYERLLEKKKAYLGGLLNEKKLGRFGGQLKTVYQACMDEGSSKKEEKQAVQKWTQKMAELSDRQKFLEFLGSRIGSEGESFIGFGSQPNLDHPEKMDFFMMSPLQSLPERTYYENSSLMSDWTKLLTAFFETIGMDHPKQRAQSVAQFEKEFSKTFPLPAELNEVWNSRTQVSKKDLLQKFPSLHLKQILARVPHQTLIRNLTPANFAWLNQALTEQPLETLQNVFLYHELRKYLDDAYPEYFNKAFAFSNKYLGGPAQRPVRQERCTTMVMNAFPKEIDFELLPRVFPNFPTQRFIHLAEGIRSTILKGLQKNRWLSPEGKKGALSKIKNARLQLVKPLRDKDWNFNPVLTYSPTQSHLNAERLRKASNDKDIRELSELRNKSRWEMGPLTVNAYYSPNDNKFVLPIGILQYPFYDPKLPDYVNYGAVGTVIGHELGHGVDDQGSKYDETGKFKQWLSPKDLLTFKERSKQLVTDFDRAGINGQLTLGENIGDLVGVTFGYQAAFPNPKAATPEKKQAFFLQMARNWCGVSIPKDIEKRLKVDYHSPFYARVNEQVKYQPGFAEAFSCKEGDPMALPAGRRVTIW